MAAVWADRYDLERLLRESPEVEVAAFNSPTLFTISGPSEALLEFRERSGVRMQPLVVSHAFHSRTMVGAGVEFQAAVTELLDSDRIGALSIPCAATSRPGWHDVQTISDADSWRDSLSGPVDFVGALHQIGREGGQLFVELSPRPTLLSAGQETLPESKWVALAASGKRNPKGATAADLHSLVRELAPYTEPNWAAVSPSDALVEAPMYPFQRDAFWITKEN